MTYWAIKQWRMHSRVMMGVLHSAPLHNQLVFLAVDWWVATSCLVELSVYKYFLGVNTILSYLLHLPPLSLSLSLSRIYTHGQGYQRPSLRRTRLSGIKVRTWDNLTLVFPSIQLGQYQPWPHLLPSLPLPSLQEYKTYFCQQARTRHFMERWTPAVDQNSKRVSQSEHKPLS